MTLPFDLREELEKLRKLELAALKADNAVLRQRLKIFPPIEQAVEAALNGSSLREINDRIIVKAVKEHGHERASRTLGIGRSTIYKRLRHVNGSAKFLSVVIFLLLFWMAVQSAPTNSFNFSAPGEITLSWDAPPPCNGCPTNYGYLFYASTNAINKTNAISALVKINTGTNRLVTLDAVTPGRWWFAVSSYATNGLQSVPSDNLIVQVPAEPVNLITVLLQWNAEVASTNWTPVGFFRVKLGP